MTYHSKLFDINVMAWICQAGVDDFDQFGVRTDTPDGSYVFIDRGANLLAVAHRDTVCDAKHFRYNKDAQIVYTPTLDDRLGCTILMSVLHKVLPFGSFDILLTEGEEKGRSTAKHFVPPREYNWMFEFDRGGTDVVHYQYTDPEWLAALEDFGVDVEVGQFSDISYLERLGVCGVNIGCAYYQYHSPRAYCKIKETEEMIERFALFYDKHKDTKFVHDSKKYDRQGEIRPYIPPPHVPSSHVSWRQQRSPWDSLDDNPLFSEEEKKILAARARTSQGLATSVRRFAWTCDWCGVSANELQIFEDNRLCKGCYRYTQENLEDVVR